MSREEKIRRQENANIDYMMRIHRRIDEIVEDQATADALKPWYMFMCKRPCFHNEYLPSFNRPNVHLVDTHGEGITEIGPKGPVFDGVEYELDLLIYATGFEVQKTGIWNQIVGETGIELNDKYRDGVRTLLGIHSHGYPNLFIMGGYQASFNFNLTDVLQAQGDHIAACIDYTRAHWPHDDRRHLRRRGVVGARGHRPSRQDRHATPSARPATTTSRASSTAARTATTTAGSRSTPGTWPPYASGWKSTTPSADVGDAGVATRADGDVRRGGRRLPLGEAPRPRRHHQRRRHAPPRSDVLRLDRRTSHDLDRSSVEKDRQPSP